MKEPVEHLTRTVGVVEERALVVDALVRPLPVLDQRHEGPRGDREPAEGDEGGAADMPHEPAPEDDHPHADDEQRQVAGDEVTGDRQGDCGRRGRVMAAARDRPPRQSPGERHQPHRPELREDAVALPHVAPVLEPVAGGAHDERRDRCCRAGRPAVPFQQPRAEVHRQRPRCKQKVDDPEVRGLRAHPGRCGHGRGQRLREALVVVEEGAPEGEVREPAVERGPPGVDLSLGPAHHEQVERAVVEVLRRAQLSAEDDEAEDRCQPGEDGGPRAEGARRWPRRRPVRGGRRGRYAAHPVEPLPGDGEGAEHEEPREELLLPGVERESAEEPVVERLEPERLHGDLAVVVGEGVPEVQEEGRREQAVHPPDRPREEERRKQDERRERVALVHPGEQGVAE